MSISADDFTSCYDLLDITVYSNARVKPSLSFSIASYWTRLNMKLSM
jgi:hypothetical protein